MVSAFSKVTQQRNAHVSLYHPLSTVDGDISENSHRMERIIRIQIKAQNDGSFKKQMTLPAYAIYCYEQTMKCHVLPNIFIYH